MSGFLFLQRRALLPAPVGAVGAPGGQRTTHLVPDGTGDVALELDGLLLLKGARGRHGGEERPGVGVERIVVDPLGAAQLHHLAQVHDGNPVADVFDDAQVVGDEYIGEPELLLEPPEEVEHLGLNGHVQGGDRLVAHQQVGIEGEGPGDVDALALTAGELVGEAVDVLGVQAHHAHELPHPLLPLDAVGDGLVDDHGLLHDLAAGLAGVQGGVGVLEDHLDLPPQGLALPAPRLEVERLPLEDQLPGGGGVQPHDAAAQGGLAAAGLTDHAQGLAPVHLQIDMGEGVEELGALPDLAGAHLKVLAQVTDFQQDFLFSHGRLPPLVPAAPRRSAGGRPPDDPARAP